MRITVQPGLEISVQRRDDAVLVVVTGELDLTAAPRVVAELKQLRAQGGVIVVDLSGLTFLDSSGIAALLESHRLSPDAISFVTPTGQPLRALQLCGLLEKLPWAPRPAGVGPA